MIAGFRYAGHGEQRRRYKAEKGSDLAKLRVEAHKSLDVHWQFGPMTRSDAYARLAKEMKMRPSNCHIGMFNEKQCRTVIELCGKWVDPD